MSKFTTELRYLIETEYDLGLKSYPIFNEEYRESLNNKIIQHYYFREIGFETAGLFKWHLNVKMNEIMPKYNQYYESVLIEYNPLVTYTFNQVKDMTDSGNNFSNVNGSNKDVFSDTPQGMLSIGDIENEVYATNATIRNNSIKNTGNFSNTGKESTTASGHLSGESQSKLIQQYRDAIINVDMMIIEELEELFMCVWD